MFDGPAVPRGDGCEVADPSPMTPYEATARPIKEFKGQREYLGGPPVIRAPQDYDQARAEAIAESG